jgi:hypothetical protein
VFVKSRLVCERAYLVHARKVDLESLQGMSKTYFFWADLTGITRPSPILLLRFGCIF